MPEAKSRPVAGSSVAACIAAVPDTQTRADCEALAAMMVCATGAAPVLWGGSIVAFGRCHFRDDSGREGDSMVVGFSPRMAGITLDVAPGFSGFAALVPRLGQVKPGKSCLSIKRLADVDIAALRQLIEAAVAAMAPLRTDGG